MVACGAATRGGALDAGDLVEETLGVSPLNDIIYNPHPSNMMKTVNPPKTRAKGVSPG